MEYYWVIDQAEYATDVIFRDKQSLQALYPRLLDYAAVNFSAGDILMFLGRRLQWRFNGEVLTGSIMDIPATERRRNSPRVVRRN